MCAVSNSCNDNHYTTGTYFIMLNVKPGGIKYHFLSPLSRVFANGSGNWSSIPVKSYKKLKKMVLDAAMLSTQHNKVRIKSKVEQSREWSSALSYTSVK